METDLAQLTRLNREVENLVHGLYVLVPGRMKHNDKRSEQAESTSNSTEVSKLFTK